mmetsp:Transcript_8356/g.19091  ORF Transcript_8356/g.19091 Transcript_8356/m.19091 type:complete len:439 (+) Transcript_8356:118-1434(+)
MAQQLNFCARVYQMLECESEEIIQWNTNGLSFRIIDHVRFENELLHKYFKHRKMASVQRQLNAYGFRSVNRGEHKRSFYHPVFKRGNWEGVKQMVRFLQPKRGLDYNNISGSTGSNTGCSSSIKQELGYSAAPSIKAEDTYPLQALRTSSNSIPQIAPHSYPYEPSGYQIPTPTLASAPPPLPPFVPHYAGMPVEFTAAGDAYLSLQPQGGGLFLVGASDGTPLFTVASALHPGLSSQPNHSTTTLFQGMGMGMGIPGMGMGNIIAPSKRNDTDYGPVVVELVRDAFDEEDFDLFEDGDAPTPLWNPLVRPQPPLIPLSDIRYHPITGCVSVDLTSRFEMDHYFSTDFSSAASQWVRIDPVDLTILLLFKDAIVVQEEPEADNSEHSSDQPPLKANSDAPTMPECEGISEEKASPRGLPRVNSLDDVYAVCDYLMKIT